MYLSFRIALAQGHYCTHTWTEKAERKGKTDRKGTQEARGTPFTQRTWEHLRSVGTAVQRNSQK